MRTNQEKAVVCDNGPVSRRKLTDLEASFEKMIEEIGEGGHVQQENSPTGGDKFPFNTPDHRSAAPFLSRLGRGATDRPEILRFEFFAPTFDFRVVEDFPDDAPEQSFEIRIVNVAQRSNGFFLIALE